MTDTELSQNPKAAGLPAGIFDSDWFVRGYTYAGELGVSLRDGTVFSLWAPTATSVELLLYRYGAGGEPYARFKLSEQERGVWRYRTDERLDGAYYTYVVTGALGAAETIDPYARAAGLNGERGMIIDLQNTDPDGFSEDRFFAHGESFNPTDAVIWETHIGDFSYELDTRAKRGSYSAFCESGLKNKSGVPVGIDYLCDLGITHVQLMPVFDYATVDEGGDGYNWGYDPKNYNLPDGSYSENPHDGAARIRELKSLVAALHARNIGVIMDVVYNHTYTLHSALSSVVPFYYYRYGEGAANGSGCGNETASERAMMRKYIIDSLLYWQSEYHIDGFRFDLMGLHDIDTINEAARLLRENNPNAILLGEGWTGGESPLPAERRADLMNIQRVSVAMFNDRGRDGLKGSPDGCDTGFVGGGDSSGVLFMAAGGIEGMFTQNSWYAPSPSSTVNYASCHDNLTLYDKLCVSLPAEDRFEANLLCGAAVLMSEGIPFMLSGEEQLREKLLPDGSRDRNSYRSAASVNSIKWELLKEGSQQLAAARYYKNLIALRKATPALRIPAAQGVRAALSPLIDEPSLAGFVADCGETVAVIFNARRESAFVPLPGGVWNLYANGADAAAAPIYEGIRGVVEVKRLSCAVLKRI